MIVARKDVPVYIANTGHQFALVELERARTKTQPPERVLAVVCRRHSAAPWLEAFDWPVGIELADIREMARLWSMFAPRLET